MNKECLCEDWKISANQIFNAQIIHANNGIKYTGKVFKYCPWCGLELGGECSTCEHNLGPSISCGLPSLTPCPVLTAEEES